VYPTEDQLREHLLESAERFAAVSGMRQSRIGIEALNDPAFLASIHNGRNFNVRTFETFMRWLDTNWPSKTEQKRIAKEANNGRESRCE
jgi:hypothetical protein